MIIALLKYLSWPLMILLSYLAVRWALRVFDGNLAAGETGQEE